MAEKQNKLKHIKECADKLNEVMKDYKDLSYVIFFKEDKIQDFIDYFNK
jgi:hypothetical protein